MLTSRTTSPLQSHISTYVTNLWSRRFITWPLSPAQKQNFLLLDVVLARLVAKKTSLKSLLSLTPFMQPRRYLIPSPIHIKSTCLPSLMNLGNFLLPAKEITLNFRNALVDSGGDFTNPLTETQNRSSPCPYSRVKFLGTIAKNSIVITTSNCGRWHFKHWMGKVDNSSTLSTTTSRPLNRLISKGTHGSSPLVILTHYALKLQEPSQITSR